MTRINKDLDMCDCCNAEKTNIPYCHVCLKDVCNDCKINHALYHFDHDIDCQDLRALE
jgi:hypothetical protein